MTKIVATSKERLIEYLEYKGVSYVDFFKGTGIKRGFLDSDKLKGTITDVFLAKIIAFFPDLSLVWLITGNGDQENIPEEDHFDIVAAEPKRKHASSVAKSIKREKNYIIEPKKKGSKVEEAIIDIYIELAAIKRELKELKIKKDQ